MKSVWELKDALSIVENAPEGVDCYSNETDNYYKIMGDKVYYWGDEYNKFDESVLYVSGVSEFLNDSDIYSLYPKEGVVKVREVDVPESTSVSLFAVRVVSFHMKPEAREYLTYNQYIDYADLVTQVNDSLSSNNWTYLNSSDKLSLVQIEDCAYKCDLQELYWKGFLDLSFTSTRAIDEVGRLLI